MNAVSRYFFIISYLSQRSVSHYMKRKKKRLCPHDDSSGSFLIVVSFTFSSFSSFWGVHGFGSLSMCSKPLDLETTLLLQTRIQKTTKIPTLAGWGWVRVGGGAGGSSQGRWEGESSPLALSGWPKSPGAPVSFSVSSGHGVSVPLSCEVESLFHTCKSVSL